MSSQQEKLDRKRKRLSRDKVASEEHTPKRSRKVDGEGEAEEDEKKPVVTTPSQPAAMKEQKETPKEAQTDGHDHAKTSKSSKRRKQLAASVTQTPKKERPSQPQQQQQQPTQTVQKRTVKTEEENKSTWAISEPVGGRFLPCQPLFLQNEKYLVLATSRAVHIYTTATSLLARTLTPKTKGGAVSGYALSATNPNHLYIVTTTGQISLWDWDIGSVLRSWETQAKIHEIATAALETHDVLFTREGRDGRKVVIRRASPSTKALDEASIIVSAPLPCQGIQVLQNGAVVIAALSKGVLVGKRTGEFKESLKEVNYVWRELTSPEQITCFDARLHTVESADKNHNRAAPESLDLVLGSVYGEIYVFHDILRKLIAVEKAGASRERLPDLAPRVMHWHRTAVGAVRWSLDGNYVLSGGKETVLLLWQVDTAKRQDLPHLISAIEGLHVAPSGASYAVQLADNSVMVLSTTELRPTTHIAGLQAPYVPGTGAFEYPQESYRPVPAAVNPLNPTELLLAVPASSSGDRTSAGSSYLETFNVATSRHVARQALSRNLATVVNVRPNKGGDGSSSASTAGPPTLTEPDNTHLCLSHDGTWLAMVETWAPPAADLEYLATAADPAGAVLEEERARRREVHLKFWRWTEGKGVWSLETRIEAPHRARNGGRALDVLALVADPSRAGFASLGQDGWVRVWRPKVRKGPTVGDAVVVVWTCVAETELPRGIGRWEVDEEEGHDDAPHLPCRAGSLAFSADGSLLAAAASSGAATSQSSSLVHILDPATGTLVHALGSCGLAPAIHALGLVGHHLVLVAPDRLTVWDLVADALAYTYALHVPAALARAIRLAVLPSIPSTAGAAVGEACFALALPALGDRRDGGLVSVWSPTRPAPLFSCETPGVVLALAPRVGPLAPPGFVVLDAGAEVRVLAPASAGVGVVGPVVRGGERLGGAVAVEEEEEEVGGVVGEEEEEEVKMEEEDGDRLEDEENDRPVVRPDMLARVFEGAGVAGSALGLRDMFRAVVRLYGRRPVSVAEGKGGEVLVKA